MILFIIIIFLYWLLIIIANRHYYTEDGINKILIFPIYKIFNKQLELCIIPKNFEIAEHRHPHIDSELLFLYAPDAYFYRTCSNEIVELDTTFWNTFFRKFSIKHYHYHYFITKSKPMVVLNFETWLGSRITNVANDFVKKQRELNL